MRDDNLALPGVATPSEQSAALVEVALPVPLRRSFTYRWRGDAPAVPGSRVAVPFHGRKMVGVVLGPAAPPPAGVRLKSIAGHLDEEPVFGDELLRFLREAADYYLHPLGEVLRAASPALTREGLGRLRGSGFLDAGESLQGPVVGVQREVFVRLRPSEPSRRLGRVQRGVLDALADGRERSLAELRAERGSIPRRVIAGLAEQGLVEMEEREVPADPFLRDPVERDRPPPLTPEQAAALAALAAARRRGAGTHLLYGVTGSGKTEVYLRLIGQVREEGRGALLLVPEIALTPQLVGRFRARFGDDIAVLHSGLSDRQRAGAWRGLRCGELRMAIGARSAVFAPVPDLGVIVVDEEHDPSFKQEEGFRYHARDLAILRAHRAGALCVLGSATPSVETTHRALGGRIGLSRLRSRPTAHPLPDVEVVDLRRQGPGPSGHPLVTGPLHRALDACLAADGQAILFLNRRGFSPSLRCVACGALVECPACSVTLTEHRRAGRLRCHYCDFSTPLPEACPACGARDLEPLGVGTERLEEALAEGFPGASVGRLDRDVAAGGRSVERVLSRFRRRELDILVGTQMVTKGHDLPGVTLVGVVLADQSLSFPDFRASERTYQLLSQVAGRAGRGDRPGRVLFQTFQPHHPAVRFARRHDYDGFYAAEVETRRELGYVPFGRLVAVRVDAGDEREAAGAARSLAEVARAAPQPGVEVLGPAPAPLARLRGRYRFRLLLRGPERRPLRAVARRIVARIEEGLGPVRAHVDVDPIQML
ncbi:MAG: primosomal protein N' [Sandaracinaceae bacterium]